MTRQHSLEYYEQQLKEEGIEKCPQCGRYMMEKTANKKMVCRNCGLEIEE